MKTRTLAALLGLAALAVPATAVAHSAGGKGHEKHAAKQHAKTPKKVMFVFKGTLTAPGTVDVASGNAHVRKGGFVGESVTFDFAGAKVVVADTNADQKCDLADVTVGDRVLVQARLARRTEYVAPSDAEIAEAILARKLVDRSHRPAEQEGDDTP